VPELAPPLEVRAAFGVKARLRHNRGGFGGVWSDGHVVLKRVDNVTETTTMADVLESVHFEDVRVPMPVRADTGAVVVDGWAAWTHLNGRRLARGRWKDRIVASRAVCDALAQVPRPTFFDSLDHMWARGARIAWGDLEWTPPAAWQSLAADLREGAGSTCPPRQLIHGDIAGNTLSAANLPLGIVDFSPTWESPLWSECMIVTDGLLWFEAPENIVDLLSDNEAGAMLCRTTLFRLVVHCMWFGSTPPTDVDTYRRVADLAIRLR
jgi:hypothetical protein